MPFSARTLPLEMLLIGALLMPGSPALAGDGDGKARKIVARDILDEIHNEQDEKAEFLFGGGRKRPGILKPRRASRVEAPARLHDPPADLARKVEARDVVPEIDDDSTELSWRPFWHKRPAGRQILMSLDEPTPPPAARSTGGRFHLNLSRGLEYRRDFPMGDRKLSLKVHGPIVQGGPGLGLQMNGRVKDHRIRMRAYGSIEEAGVTLDFEF
jgi:hypothetical protein